VGVYAHTRAHSLVIGVEGRYLRVGIIYLNIYIYIFIYIYIHIYNAYTYVHVCIYIYSQTYMWVYAHTSAHSLVTGVEGRHLSEGDVLEVSRILIIGTRGRLLRCHLFNKI